MINGFEVLEERYPFFDDESRTPNGIDLRLGAVYELEESEFFYGLFNEGKLVPKHKFIDCFEMKTDYGTIEGWAFKPNKPYILEVQDPIEIDKNSMQTYYPRSTLLRSGCTLHTAVGDAGYCGKLSFLFINHSNEAFVLEKGVRFAQLVDSELKGSGLKTYDGDYQNDKHKK